MGKLIKQYARTISTSLIVVLFSLSLWQLSSAGWILGKAVFAQQLLNLSWQKTLAEAEIVKPPFNRLKNQNTNRLKPWPWADTWPVAKLMAPQHNIEQIVLAGDTGNSLAFAPGHSSASAKLNTNGIAVISAHRDTHFSFLQQLKIDDTFYLQTTSETLQYRIYDLQIVNSEHYRLAQYSENKTLVLVTCYPFDGIASGDVLRYLVFAEAIAAVKSKYDIALL